MQSMLYDVLESRRYQKKTYIMTVQATQLPQDPTLWDHKFLHFGRNFYPY